MAQWFFTPPSIQEGPVADGPLFSRMTMPRGISLLVNAGTVTEVRYPVDSDTTDADAAYIGGHMYEIEDAAADVLIAAGYGAYLALGPDNIYPATDQYPGTDVYPR